MKLVLASASPRRCELMRLITTEFTVCPTETDETLRAGAPLAREVVRLSRDKAAWAQKQHPDAVCIGSDTMVTIDDMALGKPRDAAHAATMLRLLRGRSHEVLTGLAVLFPDGAARTLCAQTRVLFRAFDDRELDEYVKSGEPLDKAGAYGIQGRGALLVSGIAGDYYSVMGLPVASLYEVLREANVLARKQDREETGALA